MKVLFLMFAFPELDKSYNMFTTLVEEFAEKRHEVVVVAPGKETAVKIEKGIKILRVKTLPIKNVSNYLKGLSNLLLPYQFEKALNKFYKNTNFDLVISSTPPITLVDLAGKIKKKHKAIFYLILRDIFPQNAIDLGFMKPNSVVHQYFRRKEIKLYRTADHIGCMSNGNIQYLLNHNPQLKKEKLHELKNFQKVYTGFGRDYSYLKEKYDLQGKFVVVFGGNMGKPQQLENVLHLADSCKKYPDVLFLLLGEGNRIRKISSDISAGNLTNIRIQSTIPKQEYQNLLSVCDVGLISLHEKFTIPNIPSKSLDYFNVGLPVLASIDKATDFNEVLNESKAGLWSYSGDHATLLDNFEILFKNSELRTSMRINGRQYFEKYLRPEMAYNVIISQTIGSNE